MEPENLNDPVFGDIHWNSSLLQWEGVYPPESEDGFIVCIKTLSLQDRLPTDAARKAFTRITQTDADIRGQAARFLLNEYNQEWNEEEPITAENFSSRLVPEIIVLHADGSSEVGYYDDDMFHGQVVVVRLDPEGKAVNGSLEGGE